VQADVADAEFPGDLGETLVPTVGGDADQFEPVAVRGDDAQRALADGTGGAEEDNALSG
jgi:hypothetical protein